MIMPRGDMSWAMAEVFFRRNQLDAAVLPGRSPPNSPRGRHAVEVRAFEIFKYLTKSQGLWLYHQSLTPCQVGVALPKTASQHPVQLAPTSCQFA